MSSKKFDILTIGGATRDIIFYTDEGEVIDNKKVLTRQKLVCFEQGAKINIKQAYFLVGGGACNTAIAFSRLGFRTGIISRVGDDKEGDKIQEDLKHEGVDTSLIQIDGRMSTGFSFITVTVGQEHTAFLFRGANDNLIVNKDELNKIDAKWIYVSSLTGNSWQSILSNVISQKKAKIVWNLGATQLKAGKIGLNRYLSLTNVLILNHDEAVELVLSSGKTKNQVKKIEDLLKTIYSWGVPLAVITDGEAGAYVYDGKKVYYEPAKKVKTLDTTGAGDAFGSSFVAGLHLYNDVHKALGLAMVNSAAVVTGIGAQAGLLRLREIEKLS